MDDPTYALRFPFHLPEGRPLLPLESPAVMACRELSVKLEKQSNNYVLTIAAFPNCDSATAFIPRVYAGMAWALLGHDLSAEFDTEPQSVRYSDDPKDLAKRIFGAGNRNVDRVDVVILGASPAVIRMDKTVSVVEATPASIIAGIDANMALSAVTEGASFPNAAAVIQDAKLRTALDLYSMYFRERSGNARFLTLVMALETLAPDEKKPPYVVEMIEQWVACIQQRKHTLEPATEEWANYDALETEIAFRREVSIRKRIRTLVRHSLQSDGEKVATETASRAVKLYDKRSRLVHDGYLPQDELNKATTELKEVARVVLKARLIETARGAG